MIQIIVNSFVEKDKTGAVVEVLFAIVITKSESVRRASCSIPENYLAIYNYY